MDEFVGRTWVPARVRAWLEASSERYFVITGEPGTGKSMLLAWLAGHGPQPVEPAARQDLNVIRSLVAAVHFCQARSSNVSPQAFAESMAEQLAQRIEPEHLLGATRGLVQIQGSVHAGVIEPGATAVGVQINLSSLVDRSIFDLVFKPAVEMLCTHSPASQPVLLIVDAVDEALAYGGTSLVEFLGRLDDLPERVRLLVSTRPDRRAWCTCKVRG